MLWKKVQPKQKKNRIITKTYDVKDWQDSERYNQKANQQYFPQHKEKSLNIKITKQTPLR